jgi:hypothetical protein
MIKYKMTPLYLILISLLTGCVSFEEKNEKLTANPSDITTDSGERKTVSSETKPLSKDFKDYWYAGNAEITSYNLEQARYGEMRKGEAVMIFVTEPFVPGKQVKADQSSPDNISVLKLNSTKNFLTGIYPYSIMSSTFYPVADNQHALKITSSIQEWCGQVYAQLNNRDSFLLKLHSYFEKEGDQELELPKTHLENEIWTRLRIHPQDLPTGEFKMIPALEYLRLVHQPVTAYEAVGRTEQNGGFSTYTLSYPQLKRTLQITYSSVFPYTIEGWTDTYPSGFGAAAQMLTSKATKIKTLKTPYWQQNGNEDVSLRDTLGI